jgi:hypothetical protein
VAQVNFVHAGRGNDCRHSRIGRSRAPTADAAFAIEAAAVSRNTRTARRRAAMPRRARQRWRRSRRAGGGSSVRSDRHLHYRTFLLAFWRWCALFGGICCRIIHSSTITWTSKIAMRPSQHHSFGRRTVRLLRAINCTLTKLWLLRVSIALSSLRDGAEVHRRRPEFDALSSSSVCWSRGAPCGIC